jgi:hypothetical protein
MNSPHIKSELAKLALKYVPASICDDLLADPSFLEEYGLEDIRVLSFGEFAISLRRSDLFNVVRGAMSSATVYDVIDLDDQVWQLKNISDMAQLPKLVLSRDGQGFVLPDLSVLSSDVTVRLRSFDAMAAVAYLPAAAMETWRSILVERGLKDIEVNLFFSDFHDTPVEVAKSIRNEIENKKINISTLVPYSSRYYERLVGVYDDSPDVRDYAIKNCRSLFSQLSSWHSRDGFLLSLILSSHSSISDQIDVSQLSTNEIIDALEFLEKSGDRISQLGAIEVGLRVVQLQPEIKPNLIRLIQLIFDDKVDEPNSGFNLISVLFLLVDGELSKARLFSANPPFYRRLVALSQAALIQRQLVNSNIDIDNFCEWAISKGRGQFFVQTLVDMRLEPRWNPDFAVAMQIKADFVGRLVNSARRLGQDTEESELPDLIFANAMSSFNLDGDLIRPYLPGPLEGNIESISAIPTEIVESIQVQVGQEEVSPASFIALVNSALLFRVDANQAELAAKALNLGNHRLKNIADKPQLTAVLNGLALVAAVSRSRLLADELRILTRIYRYDSQFQISIEEAIRICLTSSASIIKLIDWRDYVGDWLTELAFSDLLDNEGVVFVSYLHYLLQVVPELWVSCGRAEAALQAFIASKSKIY